MCRLVVLVGGYAIDELLDPRVYQRQVTGYTIQPHGASLYLVNVLVCVSYAEGKISDLHCSATTLQSASQKLRISCAAIGILLRWYLRLAHDVTDDAAFATWNMEKKNAPEEDVDGENSSTAGAFPWTVQLDKTSTTAAISFALRKFKHEVKQASLNGGVDAAFLAHLSQDLTTFAQELDRIVADEPYFQPRVVKQAKTTALAAAGHQG